MPETFVLYACVVVKPDVVEPVARCIEWLEEACEFIDSEAYSLN